MFNYKKYQILITKAKHSTITFVKCITKCKRINTIKHILGLSDFEDLSNFIKENRFYHIPLKTGQQSTKLNIPIVRALQQINPKQSMQQSKTSYNQMLYMNNVGYGFTDDDFYLIQQSLKSIAIRDANIINIRFLGKLFTQQKDYYVIEGPQPSDCDVKLNEYVRYVTQDCKIIIKPIVLEDWALLPQVTRKQIEASRYITYVFSGNSNKEITQYPLFDGKEKHLLKAQILRITHANLLAPRGLYRFDEDTKKDTFENELFTMDGWVHLSPNISKQGRITFYEDPSLKEEQLNQMKEPDPELERLKSIKDDKPFEKNLGDWNIKIF